MIRYVAERVTISAAQLQAWSASPAGTTLNLTGPCPACGHDAPNSVPLEVTALEAMTAQASRTLTAALRCTCDQPHPDRPADVPSPLRRVRKAVSMTSGLLARVVPDP